MSNEGGGFFDKVKDFIQGNPEHADKADQGIDKAEGMFNERTDDTYADKVAQGEDTVRDKLGIPGSDGDTGADPAAGTGPASAGEATLPPPGDDPDLAPAPTPEVPGPTPDPMPSVEPETTPEPMPTAPPPTTPEPMPTTTPERAPDTGEANRI